MMASVCQHVALLISDKLFIDESHELIINNEMMMMMMMMMMRIESAVKAEVVSAKKLESVRNRGKPYSEGESKVGRL